MNRQEKINLMMTRFVHKDNGFAQQYYADGSGKLNAGTYFFRQFGGECTHDPPHKQKKNCPDITEIIFTESQMKQHLLGTYTYAPYQLSKEGMVKWVCFDIDGYRDVETKTLQQLTIDVVKHIQDIFGPNHCLVEESGSKGYHVWVFFDEPLDVRMAFAFGHTIIQPIRTPLDVNIEVYPKQQTKKKYGNTVKLPLGIHQKTGNRCLFVSRHFTPLEDQWKALRDVQPIPLTWIEENIEPFEEESQNEGVQEYKQYNPKCLSEILVEGCGEGIRDESAFRTACYLRHMGIPEDLAFTMMEEWNRKNHPPLEANEIELKVEQAYSDTFAWQPCHLPAFDHVCQSSCEFFKKKVKLRWHGKKGNPIGSISRE